MKQSHLQFQVNQLRQDKMIAVVESIMVFVFALFTSAILPSLLIRYVFAGQQLLEEPKVFQYIPLAAFTLGIAYFINVVVMNLIRSKKISDLEEEMLFLGDEGCNCGHDHGHDEKWEELDELDRIVEEAIAESKAEGSKTATKTKKVSAAKASKTATKKGSAKTKKSATKKKK